MITIKNEASDTIMKIFLSQWLHACVVDTF